MACAERCLAQREFRDLGQAMKEIKMTVERFLVERNFDAQVPDGGREGKGLDQLRSSRLKVCLKVCLRDRV